MPRSLALVVLLAARAAVAEPHPAEQAPPPDPDGAPMAVDGPEWDHQPIDDGHLTRKSGRAFPSYAAERGEFTVDIAPDGEAHVRDAPNWQWKVGNPPPTRANERKRAVPLPPQPEPRDQEGERPFAEDVGSVGVSIARFDTTDWLMRRHGMDPYAAKKLAALDGTRDRRARIGEAYRADRLAHAGDIMGENLDRLWATERDPARRKRELFALWDECAETGPEPVVKATADARARVTAFVQWMLPSGSPDAYTGAELAELNAHRASAAPFAPYEGQP